jgi:taurine dioxygenase
MGCGVLVSDLQLSDLSDTGLSELRSAFTEHGLLFFRDQQLSPRQHLGFAKRFGEVVINRFFKPLAGYAEIAKVEKDATHETNIGGGWHTDHSYDKVPAMGSILVARKLPKTGGDTRFANLYAAYEALSPDLRNTLKSLSAVHSNAHLYGEGGYYSTTDLADRLGGTDCVGEAVHPVVIRHPESGRKALYVNPAHTIGIKNWSMDESQALLDDLYAHVDQQQFTCQFNWLPGSVAFWDNRCTWHFAQNDYQGQSRLMHRITLAGSELAGCAQL